MTTTTEDAERLHAVDPQDWSWSESWFLSFVDLDGGPACTFRVGVLPNQGRAMVWCFLHVGGEWVTVEETRVALAPFDVSGRGIAYDRWGLSFSSSADESSTSGRFRVAGIGLVRSGPRTGARVPFSIDLAHHAAAPVHGTGVGEEDEGRTSHPTGRFEQSLTAEGTVVVDGVEHGVRAGAHRDKSWGPRDWRHQFAIGDLQGEGRELYYVGRRFPGEAGGYLRIGSEPLVPLVCVDGAVEYDDPHRTITEARMTFSAADGSGGPVEVALRPLSPSVQFDVAHSVEQPEHWLYWRALVEAEVSGWGAPVRGWFEAGRYGIA